jgi:oligopeptide transport system permease protein
LSKVYAPDDPQFADLGPERFVLTQLDDSILDAKFETKPIGFFKDAAIRFSKSRVSIIALIVIAIVLAMAIVGPNMNEYGYNDQNMDYINLPPKIPAFAKSGIFAGTRVLLNRRVDALGDTSRYPEGCIVHKSNYQVINGVELCDVTVDYYKYSGVDDDVYFMFGTDYLGRDLWTRVWRGARISLVIAFVSVILNSTIGLIYGSIAGYYGGSIDMVMMRITEIINAMPTVVVVTLFILYFGNGLLSIIMALVVQNWIGTARMIRAQFYRFKNSEYVLAARTLGVGDRTLMSRHILPNSIGPIITRTMVAIPSAIFTESFLAYIGLGIRAPESSIGVLLSEGQKVLMHYPEQTLFPALLISVLMIAFNMLSNGLRDAFDPTQRGA